jgi:hypothetical protein
MAMPEATSAAVRASFFGWARTPPPAMRRVTDITAMRGAQEHGSS